MEIKEKNQPVYYYDRAKRMEKASDNAQFIVNRYTMKRPGILRSLTATGPLRYLFFSIIVMTLIVFAVSYISGSRNTGSIGGIRFTSSALWFEGHVYVTVRKAQPWYMFWSSAPKTNAVVAVKTGDGTNSAESLLQSGDDSVKLRFEAQGKPDAIAVVLSINEQSIHLFVKVE